MRRVNKDQKVRINLTLNGRKMGAETEPRTLLSDFLRHCLGATGTHVGCEHGVCGCCTVQIDGAAVRSCLTPVEKVAGRKVTTIEGLSTTSDHPLQKAWIAEQVPQCGYCQSGQIMQAASLLSKNKNPSRDQIVRHMDGNLCRCGTYQRIVRAIQRAAKEV